MAGKRSKRRRWRDADQVGSSHNKPPCPGAFAACISRADKLTTLPMTVYSRRLALPIVPQNARPVVTPIDECWPASLSTRCIANAARTALSGSSGCPSGGKPRTAISDAPLSSTLILLTLPSNRYKAICKAFIVRSASSNGVWALKSGKLMNITDNRRCSPSQSL